MRVKKISTPKAIERVLLTPFGSRVMRPEFGSELYKLIDEPFSEEFRIDAMHYVYEAIENNLPEVKINSLKVEKNSFILDVLSEDYKGEVRVEFA